MAQLVLVGLPLGNIQDITERARQELVNSEQFLAEDTRNFIKVMGFLGLSMEGKKVDSFHDHNQEKTDRVIQRLLSGEKICLVSDAGSPLISDPAYPLVKRAIENNIEIETIPGVTSPIVALELSGLPPTPFSFHGFLPRTEEKKSSLFSQHRSRGETCIYFESPHRIEASLESLAKIAPSSSVAVCRELTKKFQSIYRFKSDQFRQQITFPLKGEIVLVVHYENGEEKINSGANGPIIETARKCLEKPSVKNVSKLLSQVLNQDSKSIYRTLTEKWHNK